MTKFIEGLAKGNHKDIKLFHLEGDYMFAILSDPEHGCYLGGYGGVTVHSKDETGDFTNAIEVEWTEGDTSLDTGRLEGAFLRFMRRDSIQDLVLTCHHTRDCHNGWLMVRFTKGPDNTLLASYYRHTGPLVPELLQRYIEPK